MKAEALDWSLYTTEAQRLESRLEELVQDEKFSNDDRRLCRVYIGIADSLVSRMDDTQKRYLSYARKYLETGEFPIELHGVSEDFGRKAADLALQEGLVNMQSDQQFILRLLESCTRRKFTICPQTDVEPLAWAAAAGVPLSDLYSIVKVQYPGI